MNKNIGAKVVKTGVMIYYLLIDVQMNRKIIILWPDKNRMKD